MRKYLIFILLIGLAWGQSYNIITNMYGGEGWDGSRSLIQTSDNGFAIIGLTQSFSDVG
tara:strand:+ start:538 stop:714 length:177 start_codon:yes stop_codon:yes gene_type:complete